MYFRMLTIWLLIAAVPVIAVLCAYAEERLDNSVEHHQQDQPRGEDEPDLIAEAA